MKNRVYFVIFIFFIAWSIILSRVYYLSIKKNKYYANEALENIIKLEEIAPVRGIIKDRNSKPLAVNKLGFSIAVRPHLTKKSKLPILEKELKFITENLEDQNYTELMKIYKKKNSLYKHEFIKVIDFIPYDKMISEFTKFNIRKNIKIEPAFKRYYPMNNLASHVIGYVAKANEKNMKEDRVAKLTGYYGKDGLEKKYNRVLEGTPGFRKIKVNAYNKEIETLEVKPAKSNDITLSLDIKLQKYITEIFKDEEGKEHSGVVIVMNAKTGEILTAMSNPEYNLNKFVSGMTQEEWKTLANDFNHPFTNKIINGKYPPGSVVKMAMGLSFLNSHLFNENKSFYCSGAIKVGSRKFRCWSRGHGKVNLIRAIRESCDVYFYEGSLLVGINHIAKDLTRYGFGKITGVDLPFESHGILPSKEWKRRRFKHNGTWYKGETVVSAIGQGYFLVTPLQIATYTALLASGKKVTPHFVSYINDRKINYPPKDVLNQFEKSKLPLIRSGMYQVTNHPRGTAFWGTKGVKVTIAGKTGTAQVVGIPQYEKKRMKEKDMEYYHRSHAWLTTYGPYENPQYIVTVIVEHGGHGGSTAGHIVAKIYNKLLEMGYIKSEK